ncbi:Recombinase [Desulfofarcimen acetoxidans DSM 771]|uniref:Recombinase n=1 Tax=Desulfofarcimen acetoxidans (strain ATCC 49208 / DSM 771 / KCTC 5769 / VKM B-1644 / 5575) TaxID=485916 RepID=C8VVS4_DESAS|nr:recombinase family protein [Desulfofarcimen acetoxidans]ACV62389.1 Recombinase [Desulfofarcimen acetoxidans DSM 771]
MVQRHMPIGYRLVDGKIQLDEHKAAVVKRIFSDYLSGASTSALAKQLTELGFPNANNKASWNHGSIGKILENVKYLGDEFYPQMIEAELFGRVQQRRQERCDQLGRSLQPNSVNRQYPFTGRLRCGECGEVYRKYVEHSGKASEKSLWKCKKYIYKNRVHCRCGFLSDEQIKEAFLDVINRLLARPQVLDRAPWKEPIANNREFNNLDQQIKELEAEGRYSSKELPALIFNRAKALYKTARINDAEYNTEKMKQMFSGKQLLVEFDEELFDTVVKQITVHADHQLVFEFINGLAMETGY